MSSIEQATDGLLARRAADGDGVAFGVLVRRHAPFWRAFATRLLRSAGDAEDCVQESLITAWEQLPKLQEPDKVRAWVTTIVSRKATDRIRSRRFTDPIDDLEVPAKGLDPERAAVQRSQLDALGAVLAALPEEQRTIWLLREVAGESYDDIAAHLGVPVDTVRGRLARARRTVIDRMKDWR
ncbi:RNA polymerase sigma factor [Arenivirga flava]|uniref:DNA-directed RNA polymerase sigma-70 factor n=1 Tax=Arenivirga flava TaxID=1930060 RepID=A0AA37XBM4_9MICO|nr:sigma-70 family RNA polymerase sigma factor [Arenivirga flava]GMA28515.1 DNA-directed RNA polymerase sigma-70 factor [Arenivirga flava]